jgi:ribose-phosphate pyrophosphokinase
MISLFMRVGKRIVPLGNEDLFVYPDGSWDMKHQDEHWTGEQFAVIRGPVDANDFIQLQLWSRVVKEQGGMPYAIIPQLPAAQGDRGVTTPGSLYAKMINDAGLARVVAVDVHSPVAAAFYDKLVEVPSTIIADSLPQDYDGVIAPDKGARDRAHAFADELGVPVLYAEKTRDFASGKLTGFVAPDEFSSYGNYLLVDDICVGGGTFIGLANMDLFVAHGVFSSGTEALRKRFNTIYTTDSRAPSSSNVTVLKIIERLFDYV